MKIYALVSGQLVLYVGKTTMELCKRESSHRCRSNTACSKNIPEHIDWEIVLIDDVEEDESVMWEQLYYDELMPLYNTYRPGQTLIEYNQAKGYAAQKAYQKRTGGAHAKAYRKTENGKEYARAYYQANKQAYLERCRKYRANKVE
jgi:hypothetical protein